MSDHLEVPGGDPLREGLGHTGRGLAQLATAAMAAAQMGVRVRQQREDAQRVEDHQRADAARVRMRAQHGAARLEWAPGLERSFAVSASASDAVAVWGAAQPWADHDRSAGQALAAAEERLAQLHPDVMAQYRQLRREGMSGHDAMAGAVEAARTLAEEQRFEAQRDLGAVDLASTPQVDERSEGAERGAASLELSDAANAQGASLVGRAYPPSIHQALQTKARPTAAPATRQARSASSARRR